MNFNFLLYKMRINISVCIYLEGNKSHVYQCFGNCNMLSYVHVGNLCGCTRLDWAWMLQVRQTWTWVLVSLLISCWQVWLLKQLPVIPISWFLHLFVWVGVGPSDSNRENLAEVMDCRRLSCLAYLLSLWLWWGKLPHCDKEAHVTRDWRRPSANWWGTGSLGPTSPEELDPPAPMWVSLRADPSSGALARLWFQLTWLRPRERP